MVVVSAVGQSRAGAAVVRRAGAPTAHAGRAVHGPGSAGPVRPPGSVGEGQAADQEFARHGDPAVERDGQAVGVDVRPVDLRAAVG
ncbi:hypothetical protein SDIAM103S_02982 [Streptomyces diastaticus subsp. diastaticus]